MLREPGEEATTEAETMSVRGHSQTACLDSSVEDQGQKPGAASPACEYNFGVWRLSGV